MFSLPPLRAAAVLSLAGAGVVLLPMRTLAQAGDTTSTTLPRVVVKGTVRQPAAGSLPDVRGTEVFAGKKTEVLRLDSLTVNAAQNVTRQVLARVPGANITETQYSGFPSNGIGFRGLNPVQSVETNVRQDGVNIVADLYGYPETYYTPPAEALERVELVRGSSSLQFGPQFGGVVDYVLRDGAPNTRPAFAFHQSGASFDAITSYLSAAGGTERWTYFGYTQYQRQNGWRPNSDMWQVAGAGRVRYRPASRVTLGLEYTFLRNHIHMPGGLDDAAFAEDPRQSFRARNWLASPWNVLAARAEVQLSSRTTLTSTLSYMFSQRYLVWRNEDGGASAPDTIDPVTQEYVPREVEREYFDNVTSETRLRTSHALFGVPQTLATGVRVFGGTLRRQSGGPGTTGSDFDMSLVGGPYENDIRFGTVNVAAFAENIVHLGSRLSVTPGVRVEYLRSTARGHTDTTFAPDARNRAFVLAGVGTQLHATGGTDVYANITQAYRPIEYSFLTPFASLTRIDAHLRDPKGWNADLGWRGSFGRGLTFDVGGFYLAYHDRIGLVSGVDSTGTAFTERRNVANSVHRGLEAYAELRPLALLGWPAGWGSLGVWDAMGWVRARYTTGAFAGRAVEYAPALVNRLGASYERGRLFTTLQWSAVSRQFSDANNTVTSDDASVGAIPAYQLLDWSARFRIDARTSVSAGVNNLAGARYFTMRTDEYPGPGIIPGTGRSVYAGVSVER